MTSRPEPSRQASQLRRADRATTLGVVLFHAAALVALWLAVAPARAAAQVPDPTFVANVQPAPVALSAGGIIEQPDGRILLAGFFSHVNGQSVQAVSAGNLHNVGVVRLLSDGSLDPTFSPAASSIRQAEGIALQADGRIVVRGYLRSAPFDQRLLRLNADGTRDTSFADPYLDSQGLYGMAILNSGEILVLEENWVARFTANGIRDDSYTIFGTAGGPLGGSPLALEKRPDGSLLVGGGFLYRSGGGLHPVVRLAADGTLDTSFVAPEFASSLTYSLATRLDGRIVISGSFIYLSAYSSTFLLEANGALAPYQPFNNLIATAMAPQPDGGVVVGTLSSPALIRLLPTGLQLDSSFTALTAANSGVTQLAVQADGRILVLGSFGGTNIARFLPESAAPPNEPPVISVLADQAFTHSPSGRQIGPFAFTVTDPQGTVPTVSATSDNQSVIPASGILLGGSGSNRTITISQPPSGVPGTANITVRASDGELSSTRTFAVRVSAANRPPTISGLPGGQTIVASGTESRLGPFAFTVNDPDGQPLTVTAMSSNGSVIPHAGLALAGSGANRSITVTRPANGAAGLATITVTVSDSALSTTGSFTVQVNQSNVPTAPQLTVGNPYANPVALSWRAGSGAAPRQYVLQVGTRPGASDVGSFAVGLQTSLVTAAPIGVRLHVRVVATNEFGSAVSNEVMVFAGGAEAPGAPVLSGQTSRNPITLSWTPGAGGAVTNYVLAAGTAPGASNVGVFPMGSARQVTVEAPLGMALYVRVIAQNAGGQTVSNELAFTLAPPSAPAAPILAAPGRQGTAVSFIWSSSGAGVTYTLVARTTPGGPPIVVAPLGAATSFVVPDVPPGTYYVSVVAELAGRRSPESNQVLVTQAPAAAPPAPVMAAPIVQGSSVALRWSSVGSGVTYTLVARTTQSGTPILMSPVGGATSVNVASVPGGVYYVSVIASAGGLSSGESAQVSLSVQ